MPNPADPWSFDYFAPATPHVAPPSPKARAPKLIPEIDELFTVQRNTLKTLGAVQELERRLGKDAHKVGHELARLEREAENAYRVIRSYLAKYADSTQGLQ